MAAQVQAFDLSQNFTQLLISSQTESDVQFEDFKLPDSNQRFLGPPHEPGTVLPLALRPKKDGNLEVTLENAVKTIEKLAAKGYINNILAKHGAVLFRGLPIKSADDFSKFAHAFSYEPHEIIGIVVDRPLLARNVAPANEAPKWVTIGHHNESPQVPHAPAYISFYGHKVPEKGGETPIGSSLEIFHRTNQEVPEFIEELSKKGVKYSVTYHETPQYPGNSTIKDAFGRNFKEGDSEQTKKQKVEEQIGRYNRDTKFTNWVWNKDGSITLNHILPAIRRQPQTGVPGFFTSLAGYHFQNLHQPNSARTKAQKIPTYGDGTPIKTEHLDVLLRHTLETRVLHKWEEGDVLFYDNRIAQHGREPWEGEQEDRKILASLWDGELPGPYTDAPFAKVVPALPNTE